MRVDGIGSAADSRRLRPLWGMNQLRLSNKLYALKRPMAKLTLLQQLGICVPEIFSNRNLEQRLEPLQQQRPTQQPVKQQLEQWQKRQWLGTTNAVRRRPSPPCNS